VLQKIQLWLEMDSDIILNKPDLNTCQCHGMVYRLSMSTRHIFRQTIGAHRFPSTRGGWKLASRLLTFPFAADGK